jgi:hypothetical protein
MTKKIFMLALCLAVFVAGAFAQITVSGGFALSSVSSIEISGFSAPIDSSIGYGGNLFVDYLLPVSIPMSLGFEIGVDSGSFTIDGLGNNGGDSEDTILAIPLLLRAAYHFDLMPKLDLYIVGKIGYVFGSWSGDIRDGAEEEGSVETIGGVGFGIDVGAAYYFNSKIGLFGELGFDGYMLETKLKYEEYGGSETLEAPFYRFLTLGVSVKF